MQTNPAVEQYGELERLIAGKNP